MLQSKDIIQKQSPPSSEGGRPLHGWALISVLIGLMLTFLLAALDQTIVGTALPRITGELHSFNLYSWVVTSYLLCSTAVIPIVGKLSDQFGRKWFLLAGVTIFLIGSMLSGTSQVMIDLIVYRGVQGLGAGMLQPLILTLLGDIFPPSERSRWQGLFSSVFALANVIGPLVGGWITDYSSWRWIFYVNLPIGILALLALLIWLPATISAPGTETPREALLRSIDVSGVLLAASATVCLLLGLTWGGQTYPWNSTVVIGILTAAGLLFALFIVNERFVHAPILPLGLFRKQVFVASAGLSLTMGMILFAMVIYVPLFVQGVLGLPATSSGSVTIPLTMAAAAGSAVVGILVARVGRYQWSAILGGIILVIGTLLLVAMNASTGLAEIIRNMIIVGIGIGMLQPLLVLTAQNSVPRSLLGAGTGAVTYMRAMGSTLGTAVIGSVVNATMVSELTKRLPVGATHLSQQTVSAATNQQVLVNPGYRASLVAQVTDEAVKTAHIPAGLQHDQAVKVICTQIHTLLKQIFATTQQALATGIQHAFVATLIISMLLLIIAFFLKDVPLSKRTAAEEAAAQAAAVGG